jgi:DNA-binding LacI/PurR family transcriptional regulator
MSGVSVKTVSNVINDHPNVRATTRARVEHAIAELDYRPHAIGRQLRRGRTGQLALAVPEIDVPYFAELARHVVEAAGERGYTVLVEQTGSDLTAERAVVHARESGLVDGLLFHPISMPATEIHARRDRSPMVLLGERPAPASVDSIDTDNVAAAEAAVRHLVGRGRRHIAFVGAQPRGRSRTSRVRVTGYRQALAEAGLEGGAAGEFPVPDFSHASGEAVVRALLERGTPVDAILCTSDLLAVGALRALRLAGVAVPDEVAVVGWDDIAEAAYANPSLTSLASDRRRMAHEAVALLVERIEGRTGPGRRAHVPHRLVVRESTGG